MLVNSTLEFKPIKVHKESGEEMIDLYSQTFTFPTEFSYKFVEVDSSIEARPDIISSNIYGTDKYGDLICKINGISNPFELSAGTILLIPEVQFLKEFYTNETNLDDDFGKNSTKRVPIPKRKNERRRPNEAIVGDIRYRIDKSSKIIYY